jgi:class 3 adenylate cyclase
MTFGTQHFHWNWTLKSAPEALWPLIADTNRFDRDSNRPAVEMLDTSAPRKNGQLQIRLYEYGVPLEYEQEPFEWVYPQFFSVTRRFISGPIADIRIRADLKAVEDGTELSYQVWITPKNILGWMAIPVQIGLLSRRTFEQAFLNLDRLANEGRWAEASSKAPRLSPAARARLDARGQDLGAAGIDAANISKLTALLLSGDELVLSRLRPYELADYWGMPRDEALHLFLQAVRVGLLEFRWDVLCPRCRVAKQSTQTLKDLKVGVHCDTCNIDYETHFSRSVELTFRPNPLIRAADLKEFCIGGPTATPHVLHQQLVGGSDELNWEIELEPGRYRLRALDLPGGQYFRVQSGPAQLDLEIATGSWNEYEPVLSSGAHLRVTNPFERRHLILLERMSWSDLALTAAEVTTRQVFRDLFAEEALRPGERISVGSLAVLFTDLTASTQYYREAGDAVAFGQIMSHFDNVREIVDSRGGSVVKTMGDSVMAVFLDPEAALLSAQDIQREMSRQFSDGVLQVKASLSYGQCIGAMLNGRLDYFGTTVNLASRLQEISAAGQLVLTQKVLDDPGVSLRRLDVKKAGTAARGFEDLTEPIWQLDLNPD